MEQVNVLNISHSRHRVKNLVEELSAEFDLLQSSVECLQGWISEYRCGTQVSEDTSAWTDELTTIAVADERNWKQLAATMITPCPQRSQGTGGCHHEKSKNPNDLEEPQPEAMAQIRTSEFKGVSTGELAFAVSEGRGALQDPIALKDRLAKINAAKASSKHKHDMLKKMGQAFKKFRISTVPEYRANGMCTKIVTSRYFDHFIMAMVGLNGIWIAVDTDYNNADSLWEADAIYQLMENYFCMVFTTEVLLRFFAFTHWKRAFSDVWFVFDFILVTLMLLETWVLTLVVALTSRGALGIDLNASMFRLLRLVRLTRLSRLIRFVPDLYIMVKGVLQATRTVCCTMALLFGILYVFAIALRQYSMNTAMGQKYFKSVPFALFTLMFQGTLLDSITLMMLEVGRESPTCFIIMLIVILLAALTLMNMLVGVICDVMNGVATTEKDNIAMSIVSEQIRACLEQSGDEHAERYISRTEFEKIIMHAGPARALAHVGVDVLALVDFADFFFQSDHEGEQFEGKLSFDEFMGVIMQVRGLNPATVKDIVDLRKFIHADNTGRNKALQRLHHNQITLAANQQSIIRLLNSRTLFDCQKL